MWAEMLMAVVFGLTEPGSGQTAQIVVSPERWVLGQRFEGRRGAWGARFGPQPLGGGIMPPAWGVGFGLGIGRADSDDAGPALVELIQKTIAPGHWASQGGPGTIYYWRPGRALVIRATQQTHEHIQDVLRQLQQAGR